MASTFGRSTLQFIVQGNPYLMTKFVCPKTQINNIEIFVVWQSMLTLKNKMIKIILISTHTVFSTLSS